MASITGGSFKPGVILGELGGTSRKTLSTIDEYQDLVGFRRDHILNRHKSGAGKEGKTEFPSNWSDDRIIHQISDVATDPNAIQGVDNRGTPFAVGVRDGVSIKVTFFPDKLPNGQAHPKAGQISSGYTLSTLESGR